MIYRNFGNSGLKLSVLSLGTASNWKPEDLQENISLFRTAYESGINFFDCAEVYGGGKAEQALGSIIEEIGMERERIVVSTKVWVSPNSDINSRLSTNKKHVKESIKGSLKRLKLDYVDIIFAHGYDHETPMEEICSAFHEVIEEGDSFYWATSNWEAYKVIEALGVCQKMGFHKPIGTQSSYNMLTRNEIEGYGYEKLFTTYKYGLSCWGPLAGGFLTGKYLDGIQEGQICRLNDSSMISLERMRQFYYDPYATEENVKNLKQIKQICGSELECSLGQLALAWILKFEFATTAVTGARNKGQLLSNLKALEVLPKLTKEVETRINRILKNNPEGVKDYKTWNEREKLRPC